MSTSQTLERGSITLYGERDLAGMIKLRILRWGDYPGFGPRVITGVIMNGRGESERGDDGSRGGSDVATSQGMLAAPRSCRRQEQILPWSFQKEGALLAP